MTRREPDWTCKALCLQCEALVESRNGLILEHEAGRIRCPGSLKRETYTEDAQQSEKVWRTMDRRAA